MRLSPRTDSPEVLRVSDSSPSSAESSFRELDDVFLQTQTRIWLGEVLHTRFDEETTIADLLADGELLFQVSKVIWKMLQMKCIETKYSEVFVNEPTSSGKSGGRYMPYSNVDSFFKICKILGLTGIDLFSPSDVVEKRDTRRVCMCIRSLSKRARSKRLNIPDFDVVTYTIAMPTDMVGYIRRSLEQALCSSSKFVICSRCMHSKGKFKQKIQEMDLKKLYLSSEESDDAERSIQVLKFQSLASDASYDAATLSGLFRENSPGQDSVVEENFSTPENRSRLGVQNQCNDVMRTNQYGAVCFVESGEPHSSHSITHDNHRFPTEDTVMSSQPCLECHIDLSGTTSSTNWQWSPENGKMYDADLGHSRTSVRDSPNELDDLFLVDPEETFSGVCCNKSMFWDENCRSLPKLMPSYSYASSDDIEEKFTNASPGPSYIKSNVNRIINGGLIAESKIEDYEVSSLKYFSGTGATLYSKDNFNVKDDVTGGHLYFPKFQNLGKTEKCNITLEASDADEANLDRLSPRCRDLDSETNSKYVENQLVGILDGKLDSLHNGFVHHDIYKSSIVTNGNNGHGVSAECMPSHDIYPTHVCSCAVGNSEDTKELFDSHSADTINALTLVSEPDVIVTEYLKDPSLSAACFTNTEIVYGAENAVPEKVAVGNGKTSLDATLSGLWQDDTNLGNDIHYRKGNSEATIEEEAKNMSLEQKESCHTSEMSEVMQGVTIRFCSDMLTENKTNAFSECRQGETLLESTVATKSSTDIEEERFIISANVGDSDVPHEKPLGSTFRVTNGERVLEMKSATISDSCMSLSNGLRLGEWHNQNSLLADFSEYEEKQQAYVSMSVNKPMLAIDGSARGTPSKSSSQTERKRMHIEGMQFPADLDRACLNIPDVSNLGLETTKKVAVDHSCASELAFSNNLVQHKRFSCMNGPEFDCSSAQILSIEPCSRPAGSESTREISQCMVMNRDDSENLIKEKVPQVLRPSTSHGDADFTKNTDKKMEKNELDSRTGYGTKGSNTNKGIGAEHKADRKLLLKSVAGGVTLFGAVFLMLHLRSKGKEKMDPRSIGRTAPSEKQKPSQDRLQKGKAVGIYPGERLKLQD